MSIHDEVYNQITEMIAELHRLYRSASPDRETLRRLHEAGAALHSASGNQRNRGESLGTHIREQQPQYGPGLISTEERPSLYEEIARHARESKMVRIASAFITAAEHNPLNQPIEAVTQAGGRIYILTSLMNAFNRPEALRSFIAWENLELRLYLDEPARGAKALEYAPAGFHAKSYLFHKEQAPNAVVVGSANMTGGGFTSNIEWSYLSDFEVNAGVGDGGDTPYARAVRLFDEAWDHHGFEPDAAFIERYEKLYHEAERLRSGMRALYRRGIWLPTDAGRDEPLRRGVAEVAPRPAQQAALRKLEEYRRGGHRKFAVVAATGVGKTFLSAFEVRNADASRVLFIAHREHIVSHAKQTFEQVIPNMEGVIVQGEAGIASAGGERLSAFATVQTLSRPENLERFARDSFDYIVIDEFHHAAANSYRRILEHFQPDYLLGMTATPERLDGQDVLEMCDRNVAYEVRLFEAIDRRWLAPFQYFAIFDPTDYSRIRWTGRGYDEQQLEEALAQDTRADIIAQNLRLYQPAAGPWKCLAFCSNVGHAQWMADAFTERGFQAAEITGETPNIERKELIRRLEDDEDPLSVLCSVDVLTEGTDIPDLSHILLLRPTQSPQVFLQQLGRGLRLYPGKEFVVVLDFVGNFEKNWIVPLALSGYSTVPATKEEALRQIEHFEPPAGCYVSVDTDVKRVWRERIESLFAPQSRLERMRHMIDEAAAGANAPGMSPEEVRLTDLFDTQTKDSVRKLVRGLGGWLRIREQLKLLSEYEQSLLGTPGEAFLSHIEGELHPTRSYKMAVLHALLDIATEEHTEASWDINRIAERFSAYYRDHAERRADWDDLAKAKNPQEFPISRARKHLLKNPLRFLSNSEDTFFVLDSEANTFRLTETVAPLWRDLRFRTLVRERVEYAEACYWYQWERGSGGQQ